MSAHDGRGDQTEEWVFYRDRPEWDDIVPVPLPENDHTVLKIAYTEKFRDVFDYFRAVLLSDERSERAFQLVTDAIGLNSASYTVWHYRRILLKDLGKDLYKELEYMTSLIEQIPKNYQVWHHRRIIVEWLDDPSKEKQFTASMFEDDSKNYHAWQYRQWLLSHFNLWDGELEYVDSLLEEDIRNNSAWNQRFFVIANTEHFTDKIIESEVKYSLERIVRAKNNESGWNYLRGVLGMSPNGLNCSAVTEFCDKHYDDFQDCVQFLSFVLDLERELCNVDPTNRESHLFKASSICEKLIKLDAIRANYWNMIQKQIKAQ